MNTRRPIVAPGWISMPVSQRPQCASQRASQRRPAAPKPIDDGAVPDQRVQARDSKSPLRTSIRAAGSRSNTTADVFAESIEHGAIFHFRLIHSVLAGADGAGRPADRYLGDASQRRDSLRYAERPHWCRSPGPTMEAAMIQRYACSRLSSSCWLHSASPAHAQDDRATVICPKPRGQQEMLIRGGDARPAVKRSRWSRRWRVRSRRAPARAGEKVALGARRVARSVSRVDGKRAGRDTSDAPLGKFSV